MGIGRVAHIFTSVYTGNGLADRMSEISLQGSLGCFPVQIGSFQNKADLIERHFHRKLIHSRERESQFVFIARSITGNTFFPPVCQYHTILLHIHDIRMFMADYHPRSFISG